MLISAKLWINTILDTYAVKDMRFYLPLIQEQDPKVPLEVILQVVAREMIAKVKSESLINWYEEIVGPSIHYLLKNDEFLIKMKRIHRRAENPVEFYASLLKYFFARIAEVNI